MWMVVAALVAGAVAGAGVSNWRWLRVAEEEHYNRHRAGAFRVRELFERADREHRLRLRVEREAQAALAETRVWVDDLLARVRAQEQVIRATRRRHIRRVARLAAGWPGRVAACVRAWPGGDPNRTLPNTWPVYGELIPDG